MEYEDLSPELQEKAKVCKTTEDILELVKDGRRPRLCEVSKRQREIFERLGYDLPATS